MSDLTEVPAPDGLIIKVHPETVPTTAAPYHSSATHIDALGMPVAFSQPQAASGHPADAPWPYHPTPCCGAAASISDGPMYCKGCYEEVDPAFGNFPVEPYRPIMRADSDNPLEASIARDRKEATKMTATTDKPITTMVAVRKVLSKAKKPMTAKEIAFKVVPMVPGLKGATPAATVAAKLYTEAKKPDGFVRKVDGGFVLRRD